VKYAKKYLKQNTSQESIALTVLIESTKNHSWIGSQEDSLIYVGLVVYHSKSRMNKLFESIVPTSVSRMLLPKGCLSGI
jgi:hypothetical protein